MYIMCVLPSVTVALVSLGALALKQNQKNLEYSISTEREESIKLFVKEEGTTWVDVELLEVDFEHGTLATVVPRRLNLNNEKAIVGLKKDDEKEKIVGETPKEDGQYITFFFRKRNKDTSKQKVEVSVTERTVSKKDKGQAHIVEDETLITLSSGLTTFEFSPRKTGVTRDVQLMRTDGGALKYGKNVQIQEFALQCKTTVVRKTVPPLPLPFQKATVNDIGELREIKEADEDEILVAYLQYIDRDNTFLPKPLVTSFQGNWMPLHQDAGSKGFGFIYAHRKILEEVSTEKDNLVLKFSRTIDQNAKLSRTIDQNAKLSRTIDQNAKLSITTSQEIIVKICWGVLDVPPKLVYPKKQSKLARQNSLPSTVRRPSPVKTDMFKYHSLGNVQPQSEANEKFHYDIQSSQSILLCDKDLWADTLAKCPLVVLDKAGNITERNGPKTRKEAVLFTLAFDEKAAIFFIGRQDLLFDANAMMGQENRFKVSVEIRNPRIRLNIVTPKKWSIEPGDKDNKLGRGESTMQQLEMNYELKRTVEALQTPFREALIQYDGRLLEKKADEDEMLVAYLKTYKGKKTLRPQAHVTVAHEYGLGASYVSRSCA